jgi:hypothetical protein
LQKQSMVKGLPILNEQTSPFEIFILGKHQRYSFPTTSYRAKEHLEIVHAYLCGPMQTQYIGGMFYFLTFIDDFSRKFWVYFLKKMIHSQSSKNLNLLQKKKKVENMSK